MSRTRDGRAENVQGASAMLFPTTLVGSYPQPVWLIDQAKLSKQVPRVRAHDLWLVDAARLEAAQDDATLLAIRDQERAGLDRKSTRLNSSHVKISYAVFCLKKKK